MPESDSTAARRARSSELEAITMPGVTDPYLREQLEKRRSELNSAVSEATPEAPAAPFLEILVEVNSALQRMDDGTYGICPTCNDTVEKERLLADPLVQFCLDHLTSGEQRALERDMELAAKIQRGLLPETNLRFSDWQVHYQYKPAGLVSGDYCDLISPSNGDGKLVFLFGDVAGKGVAAALLMTHLHAMFRSLSGVGLELDGLLERANHVFCESTIAGQYATLICGRAGGFGELEIASAGHFPALVVEKNRREEDCLDGSAARNVCEEPLHDRAGASGTGRQPDSVHRWNFGSGKHEGRGIRCRTDHARGGRTARMGAARAAGGLPEGREQFFVRHATG